MKNSYIKQFAILTFIAVLTVVSATISFGQTENQTTGNNVRVGVTMPKAAFTGEGVDNAQMAAGIQGLVAQYLQGSNIEIVPLEAKLDSAIKSEAKEKGCAYVLNIAVSQKKGGGGFGMFKAIAPIMSSVVPVAGVGAGVAGQIAGSVTQTAIMSASQISGTTKSKDQFALEYSLNTVDGAVKNAASFKTKAKSDGEDVISPMMEKMAEAILANAK